ncbi:MAG TPA: serine/threonine-protein kinase [Candidatus Thermoplasmatota archaeon]|jgi:hypothetical protein|nr:serine/threonine-protein kinase [Candidatus Thermoplasmatota archaeon]
MAPREAATAGLLPLYLAIGALFAALGLWVLLAAPRRNLNRALAALLLLWAGSSVVFQLMRDAATADAFTAYRAAASLYEVPSPFLFLLIADELFLPKPRSRARWLALGALAFYTALVAALFLAYPWGTETLVLVSPDGAPLLQEGLVSFGPALTLLPSVQGLAIAATEAWLVVAAVRAGAAAPAGSLLRRQAAMVAVAVGFLTGHTAGLFLGALVNPPLVPPSLAVVVLGAGAGLAALGASLYALLRLGWGLQGRARVLVSALLVLPLAAGFYDYARGVLLPQLALPGYNSTRFIWLTAFAVGLAVAILRFDLASVGTARSERKATLTTALLVTGVAGVAAGLVVSALGASPTGIGAGLLVVAAPASLALPPLRRARATLQRLVSLDARDPALHRERARAYAAALRASPSAGQDDRALRALRAELGLTARDHALLMSVLEEAPGALGPGRLVLGRYRVLRELGRGGFGEAFLARDERGARDVVLKRLRGDRRRDADALRRFRKEARLAGLLEHPHIVQVLGLEDAGGEPLLVMEYAPGGSLADRLRAGPLPEPEALRVGLEVLDALGALHQRGIVHRDVKPSNILFDAEGRAKLGDFTIAREVVSGETRGGAPGLVGTFPYLAPEQARGLAVGPAADLYALAATLYESVAGAPPFDTEGKSEYDATALVTQRAPSMPVPRASAALTDVLARGLAKDAAARHPDAAAMARALRGVVPRPAARAQRTSSAAR